MAVAVFPVPSSRRRVLIVDDDRLVLRTLGRRLEMLGFVADLTSDAANAIALAIAHDYDVVLTDLLMPGISGIELISIVAERSPVTSFILLTGVGDFAKYDSRSVDGRLTTVLTKPADPRELEQALDQAFQVADKRRALSSRPARKVPVLLLEDSATDALLIEHSLQTLGGYETTHVTRLADAVRLLHEGGFDTVITDLSLPDARGLGAVIKIRDAAPDATLLVCSSVADDAMALRVIELGAQDFIVKGSLDTEALSRAIRFARVRRQAELRLARLAHRDPLTDLPNRAAFAEGLNRALAQARRHGTKLGVMYIDLDGFKAVNDVHGHDAGDALLQEVGARIRGCVREYDVVARLGGDEFAVLTATPSDGSLEVAAERIARGLALPFELDVGEVQVTASIGIAGFPDSASAATELLKLADDAMYRAKRAGKNRICRAPPSARASAATTTDATRTS
jgi:diguanylate cyclase (GGDEF)-like protein